MAKRRLQLRLVRHACAPAMRCSLCATTVIVDRTHLRLGYVLDLLHRQQLQAAKCAHLRVWLPIGEQRCRRRQVARSGATAPPSACCHDGGDAIATRTRLRSGCRRLRRVTNTHAMHWSPQHTRQRRAMWRFGGGETRVAGTCVSVVAGPGLSFAKRSPLFSKLA